MLTNRLGLPQAIVDAVKNDPYTRGDSDISVTQLITPPWQRKLRMENEVVEDASDRVWSLVGQVGHGIVERAYPHVITEDMKRLPIAEVLEKHGVVAERRLFAKVNGWVVSGQFDVIERDPAITLQDYKFTSVWSTIGDVKLEWEQQLNLLRALAIREGIRADRLRIVAILRDWVKAKAKIDPSYPQSQIVIIDIQVWPDDVAEAFLLERVIAHQSPEPTPCADVERWKTEDVYAVMKEGNARAVKLFDNKAGADSFAGSKGKGHSVVKRPGEFRRCMEYCNVAHVCPMMRVDF